MEHIFITLTEERLRTILEESVTNVFNRQTCSSKPDSIELLSRADTAKYLMISLPTLDKLTKNGKVIAHRVGRKKMYRLAEIQKSIDTLKIKYK